MIPKKNRQLKIFKYENGAIIYNKLSKESCNLGEFEYSVFKLIDGRNTISEISDILNIDLGRLKELIMVFYKHNLLIENEDIKLHQSIINKKIGVIYDDSIFNYFSKKWIKVILNLLFVTSIFFLLGSILIVRNNIDVNAILADINFIHIIFLDVILALSISFHEFAHAIYAKNNGAFIGEIGIKLDFFIPSAYTTLCGINLIKSRYKKIQIFLAGLSLNAWIAGISLLLINTDKYKNNCYLFIIFSVNLCIILGNSIICIKTDVYYALSSILNEPNLKENALNDIKFKRSICKNKNNIIYLLISYVVQPIILIFLLGYSFILNWG